MKRAPDKLWRSVIGASPYPLALQSVAILALIGAAVSVPYPGPAPERAWPFLGLICAQLLATCLIPARRLPLWAQLCWLLAQCLLTVVAQALQPAALTDYIYLSVVLQSMVLFRLWLWIPLAVAVWAIWGGSLLIAGAGVLSWVRGNLALAFPATCAIIAAIVYLRQLRRSEQAQQVLQQVQQRYDSLAAGLRDLQQRVALEERQRLAATIASELQGSLARTEQALAQSLGQANLSRIQQAVGQTRAAASSTIERLRGAVTALRHSEPAMATTEVASPALSALAVARDESVLSARPQLVLTWVLPGVFVPLAFGLTLFQHGFELHALGLLLLYCALLLIAYACTLLVSSSLLRQAGLIAQTIAVVVMTLATQTLPLLLGMLLVLWQLATLLPLRQILIFCLTLPATIGLLLSRLSLPHLDQSSLVASLVAASAMGGPLLLARYQLSRRKQAELQAALLAAEIDQQTAEVQALAVAAERSRLAREVHDDLGSKLMLINLQMQLAEELAAEEPLSALEALSSSRDQLRLAWQSLLDVVDADLPVRGPTLAAALEQLVGACRDGARLTVNLQLMGDLDRLPPAVAVLLFRAAQEGLTNAVKHARPGRIDATITASDGYATATVINDGVGAHLDGPGPQSFGLLGLRERAEALGGGVEAGPFGDGQWRLRVVVSDDD